MFPLMRESLFVYFLPFSTIIVLRGGVIVECTATNITVLRKPAHYAGDFFINLASIFYQHSSTSNFFYVMVFLDRNYFRQYN